MTRWWPSTPTPRSAGWVPGPAPRKIKLLHEMPSPSSDWDGTPTPRSRVARMTKRLASTGAGKSAPGAEARDTFDGGALGADAVNAVGAKDVWWFAVGVGVASQASTLAATRWRLWSAG